MQPSQENQYSYEDLLTIMARLRGPGGCPWDIEQDNQTLLPYLIEETSELIEAIQNKDDSHVEEELGDVLLQVVFHAQLGSERGVYDMSGVIDGISKKLVNRHPHVFGESQIKDAAAVEEQWEEIKKKEKGKEHRQSILDDVSRALPGLQYAAKIQKRAAKVGFDWPDMSGVLDKVQEEIEEVEEARMSNDQENVAEEIGDLLFSVVNYSRHCGVDPEIALRAATSKFKTRFQAMEKAVPNLKEKNLEELDDLWNQVKKAGQVGS